MSYSNYAPPYTKRCECAGCGDTKYLNSGSPFTVSSRPEGWHMITVHISDESAYRYYVACDICSGAPIGVVKKSMKERLANLIKRGKIQQPCQCKKDPK